MTTLIETESPHYCEMTIHHGAEWYDAVPQLVDEAGDPINLNVINASFHLWIRPSANHDTNLALLTSVGSDGITIENGPLGLIAFFVPRAEVVAIPITYEGKAWHQFLRMTWTDPIYGVVRQVLWQGPCYVFPHKDTS